jgi:hypothetical protein
MLAIEAASIVDGAIDGSGHLILTTHGGTQIDAGNAIGTVPDQDIVKYLDPAEFVKATLPVEYPMGVSLLYLTSTDAAAGGWTEFLTKWGTIRTVKPDAGDDIAQIWMHHADETVEPELWIRNGNWSGWGAWRRLATTVDIDALDTRVDALEVGTRVQDLGTNAKAEADADTTYPIGISMMNLGAGSGWSINSGFGMVVTHRYGANRVRQILYAQTLAQDMWHRTSHTDIPGWSSWKKGLFSHDSTDTWTTYTPSWTSATPPAIGNGTRVGWYKQFGKTVHFKALFTFGTTTTYGTGAWVFGLPVAPHANMEGIPFSFLGVQGASRVVGLGSYQTADSGIVVYNSSGNTLWQSGSPVTWASTGTVRMSGTYEAA